MTQQAQQEVFFEDFVLHPDNYEFVESALEKDLIYTYLSLKKHMTKVGLLSDENLQFDEINIKMEEAFKEG